MKREGQSRQVMTCNLLQTATDVHGHGRTGLARENRKACAGHVRHHESQACSVAAYHDRAFQADGR